MLYVVCPYCQFRMLPNQRMCRVCGQLRDIGSVMRSIEDAKRARQQHEGLSLSARCKLLLQRWLHPHQAPTG